MTVPVHSVLSTYGIAVFMKKLYFCCTLICLHFKRETITYYAVFIVNIEYSMFLGLLNGHDHYQQSMYRR